MSGSGASSGFSSGLDPSGGQSIVGFGFWDPTAPNPTLDIAALFPTTGETDGQVLADLATLFDTEFQSAGYTASYNAPTDTLSLDQVVPGTDLMWFADSDTGLDFSGDNVPVPASEPATLCCSEAHFSCFGCFTGTDLDRLSFIILGAFGAYRRPMASPTGN
jgi:hypothetical protein